VHPIYTLIPSTVLPRFLSRIALLPLIAGLSYEVIRFAAKRAAGCWPRSRRRASGCSASHQPPADDQTAVAIRALEGAMALEEAQGGQLVIA